MGAEGSGCTNIVAVDKADLVSWKEDCMAGVHSRASFLDRPAVALKRGSMMMERRGTKRL